MPNITCLVPSCNAKSTNKNINRSRRFFHFPKTFVSPVAQARNILSIERRFKWINALKREDLTDSMINKNGLCGIHFIKGHPAKLLDIEDPDWVPSLYLEAMEDNQKLNGNLSACTNGHCNMDNTTCSGKNASLHCRTCLETMTTGRNLRRPVMVKLFATLERLMGFPLKLDDIGVFNTCLKCETFLTHISEFREMCIYNCETYLHESRLKKQSKMHGNTFSDDPSVPVASVKPRKRKCVSFMLNPSDPKHQRKAIPILCRKLPMYRNGSTGFPDRPGSKSKNSRIISNKATRADMMMLSEPTDPLAITEAMDPLAIPELVDPLDLATTDPFLEPLIESFVEPAKSSAVHTVKHSLQIKTPDQLNQETVEFDKQRKNRFPFLNDILETDEAHISKPTASQIPRKMIKRSYLNAKPRPVTKPFLAEPFPQMRLSRYMVGSFPYSYPKRKQRQCNKPGINLINVINDHNYALNWNKKPQWNSSSQIFKQFAVLDVWQAIDDCKTEMDNQEPLRCVLCQCFIQSAAVMTSHMRKEHVNYFRKWCNMCNTLVDDLEAHRIQRSCSLLYSCKFCRKRFKKPQTLLRHLEYHNNKHFHPHLVAQINSLDEVIDEMVNDCRNVTTNFSEQTNSADFMDKSGCTDQVETIEANEHFISPVRIKRENCSELQSELHEEIQIKEEPLFEEVEENAENQEDIQLSGTHVSQLKLPKPITDIAITM